jgi:hypothetical protein
MTTATELPSQHEDYTTLPATLRQWHTVHPLAGDPPNALLSVPDDLLQYIINALRNSPCIPPVCSPEAWDHVVSCLRPHWIIPLMAFHMLSWPKECRPPEKILSVFENALLAGAARNLLMGRQIEQVLTAFQEAGIPVLLVKGPALARTVYPDPALRHSSDIDLLIRPEDFLLCERIMEKLGYSCPACTYHLSRYAFHHQTFLNGKNRLMVEIHWMADFGFGYFPKNWLDNSLERKIHVQSKDLTFDTLHPADHLQFLVFHNVIQHNHRRLDWIMDIAYLIQGFSTPDGWKSVQTSSVTHHIRIPIEIAINEAILWSGHTLPSSLSDFSTWPVPSAREERLWRYAEIQEISARAAIRLRLQGLPGYGEKLKYCGRFILPPPHLMTDYRRSQSRWDPYLSHLRRWWSIINYL